MTKATRRKVIKTLGAAAAAAGLSPTESQASSSANANECSWSKTNDRVWLGGQYWANPMEDWRISDGVAEVQSGGGNRNIHLITHQLTDPAAGFETQVTVQQIGEAKKAGGAGFRVGIKTEINEYRSNAFANNGVQIGLRGKQLFVGPKSVDTELDINEPTKLHLVAEGAEKQVKLTLTAGDYEVSHTVAADQLLGNIAVVSNFDPKLGAQQGAKHRFTEWTASGDAFTIDGSRSFGPILWGMYSLSDSRSDEGFVLKATALTGPLGEEDSKKVELQVEHGQKWKSLDTAELDSDAWTATFRIPNWDATVSRPFRMVYREKHTDGSETESDWTGKFRANPSGRPLRMAALTCQNHY
ncbi:MAG: twin-arginine translocation signal domain-containing protein, partial [Planctomycetota bacterium]